LVEFLNNWKLDSNIKSKSWWEKSREL
jgi:hypothetical protein